MADHVRKQLREAAAANGVLGNLATSQGRVFQSRVHALQDDDLPGLRIYTNNENVEGLGDDDAGDNERKIELVVECCAKESDDLDDKLDLMIKEVEVAIGANQHIAGAQYIDLRTIEVEMQGEAEKNIGVARITFEVMVFTQKGVPDVAL